MKNAILNFLNKILRTFSFVLYQQGEMSKCVITFFPKKKQKQNKNKTTM